MSFCRLSVPTSSTRHGKRTLAGARSEGPSNPVPRAEFALSMWLKRCLAPGSARDMDRSSPKTLCHFFTLVRFWVMGMLARISASLSARCSGRCTVIATVSTIHPRTFLIVPQEQSPCFSFFKDTGSLRWGLSSLSIA
eukprot:scaffold7661_cov88-Skeletonema_marinoi.AAC.1